MVREEPDTAVMPAAEGEARRMPDFEQVYREHFPYVWRSLRRLGVAHADTEDVAHEVFVVVHRKLGEFDPRRAIKPWLFGIAYRLASEDRRRVHRRCELTTPSFAQAADGPAADDLVESDDRRRLVLECLQTLDGVQRAVLIQVDIDEQAPAEIAVALNVPLPTVYSRLRVARQNFAAAVRRAKLRRGEP